MKQTYTKNESFVYFLSFCPNKSKKNAKDSAEPLMEGSAEPPNLRHSAEPNHRTEPSAEPKVRSYTTFDLHSILAHYAVKIMKNKFVLTERSAKTRCISN